MATDNYLTEKAQVLLDCFDNRTQNEFIEFCKEVSQIEADVYILMARKASCFFNCLEKLGLIHFNGYVTSERVLDMRREWLTNKRVLIIDDAIVSGTSINRTIRALRESNVKSIDVRVLTVNQKWFQKDLLTDDEGNDYYQNRCNVASNEKCIDLCYRIVKAILLQPRPYDIDFPFFLGVELKPDEYNQAFNMSDWNTYDVSTVEQRKQNVYSVSIMPSASAIRDFSRRMNCALDNNTLVKIRTYTVHHIKNKDTYSVRIVPMIVFDRIDKEYIDEMFNTIVSNSGGSLGVDDFPSSSSRLRFVQFYLSYKFACYWMSRLPDSIRNKWQATSLEDRNVSFIFPSGIDEKVKHICESDIIVMPNWKKNENGCLQEHKEYKPSKITTIDPISLETRLIRPFLDMYYQKEIPCRTLVKREGKKAFNCKENGDLLQRLNVGLTIGDLVSIIKDAEAYYDIRTKVSLFIDRSIDMGIIVPITQETENCVFRAFRHGEDVLFGEKEETLYLKVLYAFQEESGHKNNDETYGITHISTEKMLVIFSKLGLDLGILEPYKLNFSGKCSRDRVLRIKPYLKGNVGIAGTLEELKKNRNIPFITDERKSMWLTSILIQDDAIKVLGDKRYDVNAPDTSAISPQTVNTVDNIGALFGRLCNKNVDTGITLGDIELTLIATCLSLDDCIKAIAAEVYIFTEKYTSPKMVIAEHKNRLEMSVLTQLKQSTAYEALNSAYKKMTAYDSGQVMEIIKKVHFSNRIEQNLWGGWFEDAFEQKDFDDEEIKHAVGTLYYNCKLLSMSMLMAYVLLLEAYFLKFKRTSNFKGYAYFENCLDVLNQCKGVLDSLVGCKYQSAVSIKYDELLSFESKIEDLYSGTGRDLRVEEDVPDELLNKGQEIIEALIVDSNSILEDVSLVLGGYGKLSKMKVFNNVLAIIYRDRYESDYREFTRIVDRSYTQAKQAYESKGVEIEKLQEGHLAGSIPLESDESVIWIVASGNEAANALASMAMNISYLVRSNEFRMVYFGNVSYKYSVRRQGEATGCFLCNSFYTFLSETPSYAFAESVGEIRTITTVVDQRRVGENRFINYIITSKTQASGNERTKYKRSSCNVQTIGTITSEISVFEATCLKKEEHMKVGIISILDIEADAIRKVLNLVDQPVTYGRRLYSTGVVHAKNGDDFSVVMTQAISQGGEAAINAYNDMKCEYHPDFVFLVGIAGGLSDDVDYSSVVLSRQIVTYNYIKDTPEGKKERGNAFQTPSAYVPFYQVLKRAIADSPLTAAEGSLKDTIHVIDGDIASGSAVIANSLSDIRTWIYNFNDKICACEMEAFGVSSTFYEADVSANKPKYGLCVIRGISDMADPNKKTTCNFRKPAAMNAAIVLKAFIEVLNE